MRHDGSSGEVPVWMGYPPAAGRGMGVGFPGLARGNQAWSGTSGDSIDVIFLDRERGRCRMNSCGPGSESNRFNEEDTIILERRFTRDMICDRTMSGKSRGMGCDLHEDSHACMNNEGGARRGK